MKELKIKIRIKIKMSMVPSAWRKFAACQRLAGD
jgi:hypothetical protein